LQFNAQFGAFTATCSLGEGCGNSCQHSEGMSITITQKSVIFTLAESSEIRVSEDPFARENRAFMEAVNDSPLCLVATRIALHTIS